MSEILMWVLIGYKKYKIVLWIIGVVIGIFFGIVGCVVFVVIYYNYNVVSWVGLLVIFVSIFLYFIVVVYCDVNRYFLVVKFIIFVNIGLGGMIFGIIGFIINIVFGIVRYEIG